ncbi:MAG: RagB/SusD family nutrient uptake outer membrane protein [Prevotella sp.]|nr:RagB/SusD family nutrient uptake outer membrane protein [Prevotella sp.]
MKNYIKLSFLSLSLVGLASCDLDAPSISSLDGSSIYSTYSLAESEVMSIHVSFGETNSYRGRFLPYYGLNTDLEVGSRTAPKFSDKENEKQALWNYDTPDNNTQMNTDNNAYAKFYEGIERANLAIEGIRAYGDLENNANLRHLLGEALTLRAVIYNDLIKAWGDVPARFVPNNADNVYLPRTNRDSIYKVLLADLLEAEDYCYWPNENEITKSTERVSKAFVKGLRARLALYAGGYGLRGDGYRRSYDPDLAPEKMYQIAAQECEDIINRGSNTLGSFEQNFRRLCEDNTTAGTESLWEIPFSETRGRVLYTWGLYHREKDQYTQQNQGGVNGPIPYLYYDFDADDVRRDITCVPYRWSQDLIDGKSYQELGNIQAWNFGKLRYEWMKRIVTNANDDGINWQYMRLADVYLMAAEAENELGNTAKAWTYLEPVLNRALPAAKVAALKTKYTASKTAFFNGIVEQRAFEFAGEALRKQDLIRWGIIDEQMALAKQKLTHLANRTDEYAGLPDKIYYFISPEDNETIILYGMSADENEDGVSAWRTAMRAQYGNDIEIHSKYWFVNNDTGANNLTEDYINGLYVVQPSTHCLWPIWRTFTSKSNNMLNNDGIYGQLSD